MNYFEYLGIKIYLADFVPVHWLLHENEFWKDIPGYEGCYHISSKGRIKILHRPVKYPKNRHRQRFNKRKIKGQYIGKVGYYMSAMTNRNAKQETWLVHRLVAITFISNPQSKRTVNHKDGDKLNNRVSNLEWATDYENIHHAIDTGLNYQKGESGNNARLTEKQVLEIRDKCKTQGFKYIAAEYNISESAVSAINVRRIWNHI